MQTIIDKSDLSQYAPIGDSVSDTILDNEIQFIQDIYLPSVFRNKDIVDDMLKMDADEADNTNGELWTFWRMYVKPVAALACFMRLVETHGMAVTGNGIVISNPGNNTAQQVTESQRAVILKKYRSNLKSYEAGLRFEFKSKDSTFDGVEYEVQDQYSDNRRSGDMTAIGSITKTMGLPGNRYRL